MFGVLFCLDEKCTLRVKVMLNTHVLALLLRVRSDVAAWNLHFEHSSLLTGLILWY